MSPITADTITDAQIRELMARDPSDRATWLTCDVALGNGIETTPTNVSNARACCADLIANFNKELLR